MHKERGFTLIELMVVLIIVGILGAIAIPSFYDQLRKSRRSDAIRCLGEIQLQEEKWRSNHATYADTDAVGTPGIAGCTTEHYDINITDGSNTAIAFTATAAPKSGGAQVGDECGTLSVALSSGTVIKSPTTPASCWSK